MPFAIALVSGAQSTVAAALSQAMSPVANAMVARVQRFSAVDIWPRSKRRWRVVTVMVRSRVSSTSQTASIDRPMASATQG